MNKIFLVHMHIQVGCVCWSYVTECMVAARSNWGNLYPWSYRFTNANGYLAHKVPSYIEWRQSCDLCMHVLGHISHMQPCYNPDNIYTTPYASELHAVMVISNILLYTTKETNWISYNSNNINTTNTFKLAS